MQNTEQWLSEKLANYKEDPTQTMRDMFINTTSVIEQYLNSPNIATKGVLEACLKHNNLFASEIEKLSELS